RRISAADRVGFSRRLAPRDTKRVQTIEGTALTIFEAALRGAAIALLVLLGTLTARDRRPTPARPYAPLFALSVAAYVLEPSPELVVLRSPSVTVVRIISMGTPAAFWLWTVAYFDDESRIAWHRAAAWLGLVVLASVTLLAGGGALFWVYHGASLSFVGLGLW